MHCYYSLIRNTIPKTYIKQVQKSKPQQTPQQVSHEKCPHCIGFVNFCRLHNFKSGQDLQHCILEKAQVLLPLQTAHTAGEKSCSLSSKSQSSTFILMEPLSDALTLKKHKVQRSSADIMRRSHLRTPTQNNCHPPLIHTYTQAHEHTHTRARVRFPFSFKQNFKIYVYR